MHTFVSGYITFYSIDNTKWDRDWLLEAVVGDKTECIVKGLQPSTTYYFKIQARNSKGYGPFSTTVPFKTPQSKHLILISVYACSIMHYTIFLVSKVCSVFRT